MKKVMKYIVATMVTIMAFQSCGNNEEPWNPAEMDDDTVVFNQNDSAVFRDIFRKAYNGYENLICEKYHIQLDDISTWSELCKWTVDKTTKEARIYMLNILAIDTDEYYGYVSPRIVELDSLWQLKIMGTGIHGSLPANPDGKSKLANLMIWGTSMTKIPDDIFKYPDLYDFYLQKNYKMSFPEGVLKMANTRVFREGEPTRFWFNDNGFTGACPMNINQYVNLTNNNFTSVDWTGMENKDYKEAFKTSRRLGPCLSDNPITTKVPEYILSDTLAIIYVHTCLNFGNKQIDNFPSDDVIFAMKEEWKKNHPEESQELYLW